MAILVRNTAKQQGITEGGEGTKVCESSSLAACSICQVNYASAKIKDGHQIEHHPEIYSQH